MCPCGSQQSYALCCGKYIEGNEYAPTPLLLMRSRYTAFVLSKMDYLAATMRKEALKKFDPIETSIWLKDVSWQELRILKERIKTPRQGFVTFEAHYLFKGYAQILCEKSEFQKIGDQWFYIDGKFLHPRK